MCAFKIIFNTQAISVPCNVGDQHGYFELGQKNLPIINTVTVKCYFYRATGPSPFDLSAFIGSVIYDVGEATI